MPKFDIKLKVLGKRDFNGRDIDTDDPDVKLNPHTQLELATDDALGGHIAVDVSQDIGKLLSVGQILKGTLST